MKYNKEIINWFKNYFDNCYYVKHDDFPESVFMFYDKNYVRQLKLAKLEGRIIEKTDITGVCVFEQEWKNKWFCCNYTLIWDYLRNNYSFSYDDIHSFISDRLEDHTKMNVLTPFSKINSGCFPLEDHTKMNVLTPGNVKRFGKVELEDHTKMNVLTPLALEVSLYPELEDHTKMNVLTAPTPFNPTMLEEHSKMTALTPTVAPIKHINFHKEY